MKNFLQIGFMSLALSGIMFAADGDDGGGSANGVFIGTHLGFTTMFETRKPIAGTQTSSTDIVNVPEFFNVGVQIGYNYYFSSIFGVRGYLDYTYGGSINNSKTTTGNAVEQNQTTTSSHNITFNVDALINFYSSDSIGVGVFAGIGLGYAGINETIVNLEQNQTTTLNSDIASGFILPINVGLSMIANQHHRIDLGFKIPTFGIKHRTTTPQPTTEIYDRLLIVTLGYSYTF